MAENETQSIAPAPPYEPVLHEGLVYSSAARCQCGAGLAIDGKTLFDFETGKSQGGAFECASLLRGDSDAGDFQHDSPRPLNKFIVKHEFGASSLPGVSTRPTR